MPKFIDPEKCKKCSNCALGCAQGAKWTADDYLSVAEKNNARVMYGTKVECVLVNNGRATGVSVSGPQGRQEIPGDCIILSAGGLGTPVILQKSGITEAGTGLFMDLFVNTYGITRGINQMHEPTMALVDLEFYKSKGFLFATSVYFQPFPGCRLF